MSIAQASLAVTAGTKYSQYVGSAQTVGAVVVLNESPYGLNVSNGSSSQWIAAQTADLVPCDSSAFNGTLTITTDGYLSNGSSAPSFLVLFTTYAPGEAIRGSYPAALVRLIGGEVSTTVTQQVINDTSGAGTQIVEARPTGQNISRVQIANDGTFLFQYGATDAARLIYLEMTNVGNLQMPQGWVTGGPSTINNTASTSSAALTLQNAGGGGALRVTSGTSQFDNGAITTDGSGNVVLVGLTSQAPITLASGHQETGKCGAQGSAPSVGVSVGAITNFKTVMTNTPSSITISASESSGVSGSPSVNLIDKYGFNFFYTVSATNSLTYWHGTYTTVGNCLLAVDTAAQTLDHHCDACGAVAQGVPLAAARIDRTYAQPALSYTCAACGAIEAFNTALTAADEADTTPQGTGQYQTTRGAQAALIRALQTALGLPVQP